LRRRKTNLKPYLPSNIIKPINLYSNQDRRTETPQIDLPELKIMKFRKGNRRGER